MNPEEFIAHGEPVAINANIPEGDRHGAAALAPQSIRVKIAPIGDFPLNDGSDRSGSIQHCTPATLSQLATNWRDAGSKPVLVDIDHHAEPGGSTEASAWCTNLEASDGGLYGTLELTPKGRELITGRNYRFLSPAWTLTDGGEPKRLVSIALTNKPNFPDFRLPNEENPTKEKPEMDKEKLIAALGLPETATESDS